MVAAITHELRSPLQGVLGMMEQIETLTCDAKIIHYCKVGINSGKLMMNLVNDILDFSNLKLIS